MTKTNQKSLTIPFHIFIFLIFLSHGVLSETLQEQERSVLLKLKQHWGNISFMDEWTPSSNSHCSWPGITCTSNSVTGLSLRNVNITGPVPSFICDLKNVTTINLGDNYIPGEFPRAVFNCSKLEALDLSENYFVGTLPDDIDKLAKLQRLVLGGNNFTGDIPPVIGKLQELKVLALGSNLFNGSLAPEIGDLSNLEDLRLANNGLLVRSELPSNYTQLRKLKILWVFNSNLIGEIPQSIGDMEALEWVDLSRNDLHGKIPDGLFMLKNLSVVFLFMNKLSGDVPQVVEALNLGMIDLSENNLTGKIPEDFGKLTKLTSLDLSENKFSGQIPTQLGLLALRFLELSSNNFTGTIPREFENVRYSGTFWNNPGLRGNCRVLGIDTCNPKSQDRKRLSTQHLAMIISASIAVLLLTMPSVFFVIVRRNQGKEEVDLKWELTTFRRLNFTESNILPGLTDHNLIGSGGSGIVYRVPVNDQGDIVAVKRIRNNRKVDHRLEHEFLSEVKILSSIKYVVFQVRAQSSSYTSA
ncbi:putative LRR receptor-like serine/threonine-protein kinase [Morus notabilis]|uniref:Putative LRR receptor-like serine/threonine-protein kinase n=1 Tax=Morus notabilis TaxID=981085 RepID=W9R6V8_9ROSA|nr:putative LRR receptor-like serine/threonine-protein kinase [Morus notabilis]